MTRSRLTEAGGRYLVALARFTIEDALGGSTGAPRLPPEAEQVEEPGAAFVTLTTQNGSLRGCIGSLIAHRPLVDDVRANALAAAFEDPRFPPLGAGELTDLVVEVSVLTRPEPITYQGPHQLIELLRPNVDGVIIERGRHRATFLPQVWEQLPLPEEFLGHLCYKAGLSSDAWREGDLRISTYQVQKFEEIP
ncbi:MAG: AmmeMemoRadiSam system protein A [Anaerolineae bacterium]|nr:AmmeMemoRadiSam system protein A [Anaerolineae bacterium]